MSAGYGVPTGGVPKREIYLKPPVEVGDPSKTDDRKKHSHYFKDVSKLRQIDVYRVLELFAVSDPCIQHAAKKLLVAGGRGAGKSIEKDIQEAIDSLIRWQEMQKENDE